MDAGGDYLPEFITSEGKGFVAKVPYDTKDGSGIARIKVEISHVRQLAGGLKISEREARTLMIEQLGEWHSARFGGGRDWLPRLIADCKRRHESAVEIASILAEPDRGREPIEVGIVGPLHGVSIPQEIADAMRSLPAARKLLGDEIAAALARGIMRHVVEGQLRAAVVHQIGKANGGRLMPADVVRGACSFVTTARNPKGVSQPAQLEREVAYFAALPADQLGSIHDGGWED